MKKINIYIILACIFAFASCTNGFEDLNDNQNQPTEDDINAGVLLPTVLFEIATDHIYQNVYYINDLVQYSAPYQYTSFDRYVFSGAGDGTFDLWNITYDQATNINKMYDLSVESGGDAYTAAALIVKTLTYSITTDAYKNIPYSEAGCAEDGILSPAYDTQESIYESFLTNLETANTLLSSAPEFDLDGDMLFDGDADKWRRFGNSLYVRLLMRTSDVRTASVTKLAEIVNNPDTYPLMESDDEDAIYDFEDEEPNVSPIDTGRDYDFLCHRASAKMVDTLTNYNDPRIDVYYSLPESGTGVHAGLPNGMSSTDAASYMDEPLVYTSGLNYDLFFEDKGGADALFMTYAELEFILAEAAEKGYISGDAETYYYNGINASFTQWGVSGYDDYVAQDKVQFSADEALEQIALQKWIALFNNATEMWFDWQRTRLPAIVPGEAASLNNNGLVPVRIPYPSEEQSLNYDNYEAAVNSIGGDNINIQSWWDAN